MAKRRDSGPADVVVLAEWEEQLERAISSDDRPIVGIIAMDPSGETGEAGFAAWPHGEAKPEWYVGPPLDARTFRWIGERAAGMCAQAERVLFVAESDAFGPSIGRKLGIGIGSIQGLLLDLNAIAPRTRVDVASGTWRKALGIRGAGRRSLKDAAIIHAKPYTRTGELDIPDHAAEAIHIARWARAELLSRLTPGAVE